MFTKKLNKNKQTKNTTYLLKEHNRYTALMKLKYTVSEGSSNWCLNKDMMVTGMKIQ